MQRRAFAPILIGIVATVLLAACGGGGAGVESVPAPSAPATLLAWTPPATTSDNAVLDPYVDLDYYEIYVREDANFSEADLPVAQVSAVERILSPDGRSVSTALVAEFDLDRLPYLPPAPRLFVTVKAVGIDRQKSAFMDPVEWDRS